MTHLGFIRNAKKGLVPILLLLSLSAFSQSGDWILKRDKEGIQVYMREVAESPFKGIRVRMRCEGTLQKFKTLLLDVNHHKDWVYSTEVAKVVQRPSENEVIYYTEFGLPWPVSNRDLNCRLRVITDSIPGIYFVKAHSVPGHVPPKEGIVRVKQSASYWTVVQTAENELQIEYTIQVDPGGSLPPWLVNLTAQDGPYISFSNLQSRLKK